MIVCIYTCPHTHRDDLLQVLLLHHILVPQRTLLLCLQVLHLCLQLSQVYAQLLLLLRVGVT